MEKVLVIVGPTAVGKTKLSIELAKSFNGEVINGDSVQVYRGLDIGSAKITKDEMDGVKHHLFDIKDPDESFSVADFQLLVRDKIYEINKKGKLPIICGGTGLYIQAVLFDFNFKDEGRDERFETKYKHQSNELLHEHLKTFDPKSANIIHPNNRKRVLRAIEIYETTGKTKSEINEKQKQVPLYDAYMIGLELPRDLLYERINRRANIMVENGLIEEVKGLYDQGLNGKQSVTAIGYKELFDYFHGQVSLEEAINNIRRNTRRYAKRQFTYFKNKMEINWYPVNLEHYKETVDSVTKDVKNWLK
ncbi:tRNA (adenosine(37)-N6)-dimethylallyltransferase MiaA [Haloplasma contractile]|uniref:tRNA dimethylallyltransferase n=1 Tax=Haloplasma contractile SSD-17B TaxID=1033810 RepID=U2EGC4_9MOLU|nr:tRNA (adenosine(37)-N6)-dimethylallyltransferase MiaA [Haloplasma contractile]ERJ13666.1 tRNA dimethylallyltransferase protein [Haloplasma contractile SSD-17B]